MRSAFRSRRAREGVAPLSPRRKWRAILLATLLFAPGAWSLIIGMVAAGSDSRNAPGAAPFVAFGLALAPFVFVVLAFLSEHPRASGAVVKAMVVSLLVGIPVSAVAADAVTGLVAGVASGGAVALRMDVGHSARSRVVAVVAATVYTFLLVRVAPEVAVITAPVLPLTALGVADHVSERRLERA